jgi:hypothetical protein
MGMHQLHKRNTFIKVAATESIGAWRVRQAFAHALNKKSRSSLNGLLVVDFFKFNK